MAVQRAKKPREVYDLGCLRLYREDLEAIAGIVREECGNLLIEFHDEGQHTGNDPGDFAAVAGVLPESLDHVTLTGKRNSTTFKVHLGQRSEIVVKDPDNSARGAAHAIRDLGRARRRWLDGRVPWPKSRKRTIVVNAPRALRPTHWQRHRVLYLSNVITGTVTLLLGGFIGYLVNQIPDWN